MKMCGQTTDCSATSNRARIYGEKLHSIEGGGTIPWLGLAWHGLTDSFEPSWGGWSGRYASEKGLNVPSPFADIAALEKKYKDY